LKLNTWKLDSSPQRTNGIYSTPLRQTATGDGIIELNGGAFDESMYLSTLDTLTIGFLMGMPLREDGRVISTPKKTGELKG
jgi:hypothetical protein